MDEHEHVDLEPGIGLLVSLVAAVVQPQPQTILAGELLAVVESLLVGLPAGASSPHLASRILAGASLSRGLAYSFCLSPPVSLSPPFYSLRVGF